MTYQNPDQHGFHPWDFPEAYPRTHDGMALDPRVGVDPNVFAEDFQYWQKLQQLRDQDILSAQDRKALDAYLGRVAQGQGAAVQDEARRTAELKAAERLSEDKLRQKILEINAAHYEAVFGRPYLPAGKTFGSMTQDELAHFEATRDEEWAQYHRDRLSGRLPAQELEWHTGEVAKPVIAKPEVTTETPAKKSFLQSIRDIFRN